MSLSNSCDLKRKYASYTNPERRLRTRPEVDYRFKKLELAV